MKKEKIDTNIEETENSDELEFDAEEHFIGNLPLHTKILIGTVFALLCFTAGVVFGYVFL